MGAHDMGDHTVITKGDAVSDVEIKTARAQELAEQGKNTAEIAEAMGISENYVRNLQYPFDDLKINWRHNCLTSGPHDGRQEAVWKMPLRYAAMHIFTREDLKCLVLARIYNDAMQIVANNDKFDEAWADRVFNAAKERYDTVLQHKVGELTRYYDSPSFKQDMADAVERVMADKLNPFFEPLHHHDTINMLCRILGVPASIKASEG
jgi:hypothetical protein